MAQLGSALEWGSRGRKFKSSHQDHFKSLTTRICRSSFFFLPSLLLALLVVAETDAHYSLFRSFLAANLLTQTTGKSDKHWLTALSDIFFIKNFTSDTILTLIILHDFHRVFIAFPYLTTPPFAIFS